jgi:hypothetical protein
MHAAFVLWKNRGNFFPYDHIGKVCNFQATIDGILVREGDKPHPPCSEFAMEFKGVRGTGRKIQTSENPISCPVTVAGVDVQIGA